MINIFCCTDIGLTEIVQNHHIISGFVFIFTEIINEMKLPEKLNLFGKKPWEVPHLDTLELWKFGDYKHFTSLKLLTKVLGIPSPKDDIDGSQVARVYYDENNIERIKEYCEKDVITLINVFRKMRYDGSLQRKEDL